MYSETPVNSSYPFPQITSLPTVGDLRGKIMLISGPQYYGGYNQNSLVQEPPDAYELIENNCVVDYAPKLVLIQNLIMQSYLSNHSDLYSIGWSGVVSIPTSPIPPNQLCQNLPVSPEEAANNILPDMTIYLANTFPQNGSTYIINIQPMDFPTQCLICKIIGTNFTPNVTLPAYCQPNNYVCSTSVMECCLSNMLLFLLVLCIWEKW